MACPAAVPAGWRSGCGAAWLGALAARPIACATTVVLAVVVPMVLAMASACAVLALHAVGVFIKGF